ncbi:MAG: aminoacetone oxidase family FAD-binding enzyme, partial [Akkermansiaceae bacterium]|nr:aminoacetone oxidase family FAD-binding enzyme [Akkermansiaceae bacterium]
DPGVLVGAYPRGSRSLRGPFHRWRVSDTVDWFERHGVDLKTEADGRMFPVTDDSRTVIDCLTGAARELGVQWRTRCGVRAIRGKEDGGFRLETTSGDEFEAARVLVATGGIRSGPARVPAADLGHEMIPPVPSLFTFRIEDERIAELPGVSVPAARVRAAGRDSQGPLLVTHWGLSGPAVLKLSAWGARELAACDYEFDLEVNLTGGSAEEAAAVFRHERENHGARRVASRSPLEGIPRRLWQALCRAAGVGGEVTWSKLSREAAAALRKELTGGRFAVRGKSLNKDEFVTCGGVRLEDVNLKTMESKLVPGLFFAGEVLDIDGVTGGFNFQSAWTTARLAGEAMAK